MKRTQLAEGDRSHQVHPVSYRPLPLRSLIRKATGNRTSEFRLQSKNSWRKHSHEDALTECIIINEAEQSPRGYPRRQIKKTDAMWIVCGLGLIF